MSIMNKNSGKTELENQEEDIYFNFINSLKAEVTKKSYERDLKLFMDFCNVSKLSKLLVIQEPQKQIIHYLMSLRRRWV